MYCVYITYYNGEKLPQMYIGSTSIKKINSGYKGSVSSIEYKNIWEEEIKHNNHLFETKIISYHNSRKEALNAELELQLEYDVVNNQNFINKSLAKPNGFFGMDVSGEKNPMYGSIRKGEKHNGGENISSGLKSFFDDHDRSKRHRENSRKMFKENNPATKQECLVKMKCTWKKNKRNCGEKNGMYGKIHPSTGKKMYTNGIITKSFEEGKQPSGWILGRHSKIAR
jgi:hypothetical protein